MIEWEYLVTWAPARQNSEAAVVSQDSLDVAGRHGWELATIVAADGYWVVYMKRPKPADEPHTPDERGRNP